MPIRIMLTDHGAKPIVVCDVCGARIERAADGAYAWIEERPDSGTQYDVAFAHQGRCFATYEAAGGVNVRDIPLTALLVYLARNLELDWKSSEVLADYFSKP